MLTHTFCHLSGIGPTKEQQLWKKGILSWDQALATSDIRPLWPGLLESKNRLDRGDAGYFADRLPSGEQFRLFQSFIQTAVYLDIETTGLSPWDEITTIALYDGKKIKYYVQGDNLEQFVTDIDEYGLIISFNGKAFDLPFLRSRLNCSLDQAHIDLRYVLAGLGFKGGLKKCEKAMGIDRGDLDGVDGSFAILLWDEYRKTGNPKALETLLAYNIEDVINLETLMVQAYNMKCRDMAFVRELSAPPGVKNPLSPDLNLVDRLRF